MRHLLYVIHATEEGVFFKVKKQLTYGVDFIYADDMFRPLQWVIFRSEDMHLRIIYYTTQYRQIYVL